MQLLRPGDNVWRLARARRFAFFKDVAGCFEAMRSAMLQANRSITIVGWDIDSRTRLVGAQGEPRDNFPCELRPFLEALKRRKPELQINLLLWDFAAVYALEREAFPQVKLAWDGANLVLDSCLPVGSSQHQKLVIVDGVLAFTGGLDVTIRRWDTCEHRYNNRYRKDPYGEPYNPFHDVQAIVDGDAAWALAQLVADRWLCASGDPLPIELGRPIWPEALTPLMCNVEVGIARTVPAQDGMQEAREAERLFFDMIDAAERSIYIENQFLTSTAVAERLAQSLKTRPELEMLIVAPKTHHSWLEAVAMRHGRIRFQEIVRSAGASDRVRFAYPEVRKGRNAMDVMVHSKVMVVDDRLLRIGSANLNNRSMGADSECDLVIEAKSTVQRQKVLEARNVLLAMHCGVTEADVVNALQGHSLVSASKILTDTRHALVDIDDGSLTLTDYPGVLDTIADPERPIELDSFLALSTGEPNIQVRRRAAGVLGLAALVFLLLAALWGLFPDSADATVRRAFSAGGDEWQALLLVVAVFLLGSALMVPVTLMIVAAAASFGLAAGVLYAAFGTLVSAAVFYGMGAWLGAHRVRRLTGGRLSKIRDAIMRRGVVAVATLRLVPIAPFSLVNLAAGAATVGFWTFMAGTILGMAPGFLLLSALGDQLYRLVSEPTPAVVMAVAGLVLLWMAALAVLRSWLRRQTRPT